MTENKTAAHRLKTWPEFFRLIADNKKQFELRRDDRDFRTGDILELVEYDPEVQAETSAWPLFRRAGYILRGPVFGLAEGYCIIQLESL